MRIHAFRIIGNSVNSGTVELLLLHTGAGAFRAGQPASIHALRHRSARHRVTARRWVC